MCAKLLLFGEEAKVYQLLNYQTMKIVDDVRCTYKPYQVLLDFCFKSGYGHTGAELLFMVKNVLAHSQPKDTTSPEEVSFKVKKSHSQILEMLSSKSYAPLVLEDITKVMKAMEEHTPAKKPTPESFKIEAVIEMLQDEEVYEDDDKTDELCDALRLLSQAESTDPEIEQALLTACENGDTFVRQASIQAIVKLGFTSDDLINAIVDSISSISKDVEKEALLALGNLGIRSEKVMENLKISQQREEPFQAALATIALGKLGDASVGELLLGLLLFDKGSFFENELVRKEAGRTLHMMYQQ